jgi:hypothetical protein
LQQQISKTKSMKKRNPNATEQIKQPEIEEWFDEQ